MATIGDIVSRVRNQVKAEVQDAFVTDRYLYSLIMKYGKLYMRRQDHLNRLMKYNSIWTTLPFVELIEVDKVEAHCTGIRSGCIIKRTKEKLPEFMEGTWGPLIRTVSSIDGSIEAQPTHPGIYTSMTKTTTYKYNKIKYFWYLNGYLYLPNVEWEAIKIEGVFDDDISAYTCEKEDDCIPRHEQKIAIPEYLFAEIEQQVLTVIMNTVRLPIEDADNKQHIHR